MKKIITLVLVLCMCITALAACKGADEEPKGTTTTTKSTTTTTTTTTKNEGNTDPETPGNPEDPENPENPENPDKPEEPVLPDTTGAVCVNDIEGVEARVYAFEKPSEFGGPVGLIYYLDDKANNTQADMAAVMAAGHAEVYLNGKKFVIEQTANGGTWFRLNVETPGAVIISGVSYEASIYVYDAEGVMKYYTKPETIVSGMSGASLPERSPLNITLPENLTKVSVSSTVSCTGLNAWGDGAATNLFDGNTASTKIGGGTNGSVTVEFTAEASTIRYYSLYTGGDTAQYPERNPVAWTLYGKVNGEYVELAEIASTEEVYTGMGATNNTPYSYAVESPVECTEYKIVFITGSAFQLNELELYA